MSTVLCLLACVYCLVSTFLCLLACVFFLVASVLCLMSCVYCLVSTVLCLLSFFWYLLLYFSCRNQQTCLFMSVHWEGADRLEGWQDDQGPTKRAMVKIVSLRHHTCSSHRFWWNDFICNNKYNNHQIVFWQVVTKDSCRCGHPLISDPPTTSFTPLSLVTCDMRHVIFF